MLKPILPALRGIRIFWTSVTAVCAVLAVTLVFPDGAQAEPAVCSVLSPAEVGAILHDKVDSGIAITRSNPAAPGAIGHACAYTGKTHSAVLGLYHGSSSQLARIKQVNESSGSVTAMKGSTLVSAYVSDDAGGSHTADRAIAKKLLDAALSRL
jgi:hypothetical protein